MASPRTGKKDRFERASVNPKPKLGTHHGGPRADPGVGNTPWTSWVLLVPIFTIVPYLLSRLHYSLPEPLPPTDASGRAQPSESLILGHISALESIGYRSVGTPQAKAGEEYVINQVRLLEEWCRDGVLECEVWVQKGSGYHAFNIMDHEVLKVYSGITNVVLRISAKGKRKWEGGEVVKDAVLLGAHIDSTLPAPGASDDGMGVGVMLEVARVLVDRNEAFNGSIIFMWNGGEETLQDGSHLYSTQHETAKTVRGMINCEAAGSTGGALLFQATSAEMIEAFSHSPHPRGSAIAADVFASGIIISDTDFGQFEQYLNVSGLDMAIVGHSYFYHTRKDQSIYVERGSSQHFANNIIGIVDYLLSPSSPLLKSGDWSPPDFAYFGVYDRLYLQWSMASADKVYPAMAAIAVALTAASGVWRRWKPLAIALFATPLALVVGLLFAVAVAGIMTLLDKQLTWFRHEHIPLLLYAPPAYLGLLSTNYFLSRFISPVDRTYLEHANVYAQLLFSAWYMLLIQAYRIRSAYAFAIVTSFQLISASWNEIRRMRDRSAGRVGFPSVYVVPLAAFMVLGVEAVTASLDIFTPLTGRMGNEAPAEIIIAVISAAVGLVLFPPLVPLFHRVSRRAQRRIILLLAMITIGMMVFFAGPWWTTYDFMHPKRSGVQYMYNHTNGEHTAHIAFMDRGTELDVVEAIHERYGVGPIEHTSLGDHDPDWDVLYPISTFLNTYRFPLAPTGFDWPEIKLEAQVTSVDGLRKIQLSFDFTGIIWPVIAFDAEITGWSFDFDPPKGRKRHHIKIATHIDAVNVELELTVRDEGAIPMHWSGIDLNQMVPGTAAERGPDMPASKMLMDLDEWGTERWGGSLDFLMYGIVVGVIEV